MPKGKNAYTLLIDITWLKCCFFGGDNRFTPLHCALGRENPDVEVVFLLCDLYPRALFEQDNNGCTPIMRYG